MVPLRRLTSSLLLSTLFLSLLHVPVGRADVTSTKKPNLEEEEKETGLQFRLSNGREVVAKRSTAVAATEMSLAETENLVKRLAPIKVDDSDAQTFALREASVPPPRTGNTIETPFPSAGTASSEPVSSGPLEVVRYSPEGPVPLAPELSITFSQPMVALTSQEEVAASVPVKLNPQPPGKWRWLGTKTLIFDPDERFPMATTFVVTVPAGTRSASGAILASEKSWGFTTPPPIVKTTYPSADGTHPRDALMFVEFDQRIDPAAVLRAIRVTSDGRNLPTRLATDDEVKQAIERDKDGTRALANAVKGRWLAFRAIDAKSGKTDLALPAKSRIKVSLVSGVPSAEGPNVTQSTHDFYFSTYGPLNITKHSCNDERTCDTDDEFEFEFSGISVDRL